MRHLLKISIDTEAFPDRSAYPFCLNNIQQTEEIELSSSVTFFVGENGTGKSTFLEAAARCCGLHIWENEPERRYSQNPHEKELKHHLQPTWSNGATTGAFFAGRIFQDFTRILEEWAVADPGMLDFFGGKSLLTQSHGQSLMAYFQSRLYTKGLYFLDEPETALSPRTQLTLLKLIQATGYEQEAQFIISTHSPLLLACPDAEIWDFNRAPLQKTPYEATDHFKLYRDFLLNRKAYLQDSQGDPTK